MMAFERARQQFFNRQSLSSSPFPSPRLFDPGECMDVPPPLQGNNDDDMVLHQALPTEGGLSPSSSPSRIPRGPLSRSCSDGITLPLRSPLPIMNNSIRSSMPSHPLAQSEDGDDNIEIIERFSGPPDLAVRIGWDVEDVESCWR